MGVSPSKAVAEIKNQQIETEKQLKADLQNLTTILTAKVNEFHLQLQTNTGKDKTVPIKTFVEIKKHISVKVSQEPSKELEDAINDLFGGNFLNSLKALVLGALNVVLGNGSAGERTEQGYKVLLVHDTVVRIDYYLYGYTMHTTGLTEDQHRGVAFCATVGVVDLKSVGPEVLMYLVGSQAAGCSAFIEQRKAAWDNRKAALKNAKYGEDPMTSEPSMGEMVAWAKALQAEELSMKAQLALDKADVSGDSGPNTPGGSDQPAADASAEKKKELEKQAWSKLRDDLLGKIDTHVDNYADIRTSVDRECRMILDSMTDLYKRVSKVVQTTGGL